LKQPPKTVLKILQKNSNIENTLDFTINEMIYIIIKVLVANVDGYYHIHLKNIVFESTPKSKSHPQTEMRGLLFYGF
jgi:hypothetical protein